MSAHTLTRGLTPTLETRWAGQSRSLENLTPDAGKVSELLGQVPEMQKGIDARSASHFLLNDYVFVIHSSIARTIHDQALVESFANLGPRAFPLLAEAMRRIRDAHPEVLLDVGASYFADLIEESPFEAVIDSALISNWDSEFAQSATSDDPSEALQLLFTRVEDLADQKDFDSINEILQKVVNSQLPLELTVGVLRVTFPFRAQLSLWSESLGRVREMVLASGRSAEKVLAGLQR